MKRKKKWSGYTDVTYTFFPYLNILRLIDLPTLVDSINHGIIPTCKCIKQTTKRPFILKTSNFGVLRKMQRCFDVTCCTSAVSTFRGSNPRPNGPSQDCSIFSHYFP